MRCVGNDELAAGLDAAVADLRARPLGQGPSTFVAAALVLKVREDGVGRFGFFRDLTARGLSG